jgi:hypothetical protein
VREAANLLTPEQVSEQLKKNDEELKETERKLSSIFSVEPDQLVDSIERFKLELEQKNDRVKKLSRYLEQEPEIKEVEGRNLISRAESLFNSWKNTDKQVERLEALIKEQLEQDIEPGDVIEKQIPTENVGLLIQIARQLSNEYEAVVTLVGEKGAVSASGKEGFSAREQLEKYSDTVEGDENFAKAFDL